MRRQLTNFEEQMVLFISHCEIYYETDPLKLKDCNDCPFASFCVNHPKDGKHSTQCREAVISNGISDPYTFLFALQKISRPMQPEMIIHVIEREQNDMKKAGFWQTLLHHNLPLKKIKVSYFSPHLSSQCVKMKLCNICKKNNCSIIFENTGDTYVRFAELPAFSKPNFIIGFNLVLEDDDELAQTIRLIRKLGCPFFLTTLVPQVTETNEKNINSFLGKRVKPFWTGINPFASRQPYKHFEKLCVYEISELVPEMNESPKIH
ncbi:uncharacterized protein [Venturia canescens]|uniref:uncharacterized protein n=1 Tax=Venturia canescens TaxID=32260 RepID=UPI001C9BFD9A|nr:uncharacterized protein LOC122408423 [Venturia canescens]